MNSMPQLANFRSVDPRELTYFSNYLLTDIVGFMRVPERFFGRIRKTDSGCWEFTRVSDTGYGWYCHEGTVWKSHRFMWSRINGEIPPGMQICHHCDNPPCVNPDHLFLGTHRDNHIDKARKGRHGQQQKTHCPQGHPYSPENTHYDNTGWRRCATCYKSYYQTWNALRKAVRRG